MHRFILSKIVTVSAAIVSLSTLPGCWHVARREPPRVERREERREEHEERREEHREERHEK